MKKIKSLFVVLIVMLMSVSLFALDTPAKEFAKLENQFFDYKSKKPDNGKLPFNFAFFELPIYEYKLFVKNNKWEKPEIDKFNFKNLDEYVKQENSVLYYSPDCTGIITLDRHDEFDCVNIHQNGPMHQQFLYIMKAKNTKYIEYAGKRFNGTWYRIYGYSNGKNYLSYLSIQKDQVHLIEGISSDMFYYKYSVSKIIKNYEKCECDIKHPKNYNE